MDNTDKTPEELIGMPSAPSAAQGKNNHQGKDLPESPDSQTAAKSRNVAASVSSVSATPDSKTKVSDSTEQAKPGPREDTASSTQDVSPRASMDQVLKSEKAFIEYVMSLPPTAVSTGSPHLIKPETSSSFKQKQRQSSSVPPSTSSATKVGLDHLDNLCKLMEQLSELRETNTKLQKRVQYLEDLKTLHEMHKEIRREVKYGSENVLNQRKHLGLKKSLTSVDYVRDSPRGSEDYAVPSPRGSEEFSFQDRRPAKGRSSPSGRRSRNFNTVSYDGHRRERSKSVGHEEVFDSRSRRIFLKWSKVKEAFGWESDRKYTTAKAGKMFYGTVHETAIPHNCGRILTDNDLATLRMPVYSDYSEKDEISPMDSYAGEAMASCTDSGIPPLSSSTEDISSLLESYRSGTRYCKRDSGSSENRHSLVETRADGLRRLKSATSPGACSTGMYHEMLDQKTKSLTIERSIDPEQAFAKFEKEESKKSHKSPWGRVKTIIERRRDSLKRRHLRHGPGHQSSPSSRCRDQRNTEDIDDDVQDGTTSYDSPRKSSDDQFVVGSSIGKVDARFNEGSEKKRKKQSISSQVKDSRKQRPKKAPPPIQLNSEEREDGSDSRCGPISEREVVFRTPGASPPFHRKSTWMKMKNVLKSKKEGEAIPGLSSQSMPSSPNGVQDTTFDFEDTELLEDNVEDAEYENGHAITRVGSDSYVHKLALSASSGPVTELMMELQRNVSDDFSRKMQEWERIRNTGIRSATSPKWERNTAVPKSRKKSDKPKVERYEKSPKPKVKDLAWLEKELQKIEKEKQRLSKEKEKYEERAVRLERLRQTVLTARNSNKKEVLVRTSAGEFRFEGISDAFTKKLYEWETKRGLGPEFSTIALLDSSLGANNKNCLAIQQIDKSGNLQRAHSRSESSIADIGQPSHTSSNSLPSLKPPEIGDLERVHHHSRANSEPDLSSFVGMSNSGNVSQNTLGSKNNATEESSHDTLEPDVKDSYVHPEVTQLIDSDVDDVLQDLDDHGREQRDENYYSLLQENVILLEQLKNKEEICRRLEKELQLLDEKVEEMNKHHQQEMERYREKLWEMHKPGSTPREVQGCLQVMAELRTRIENLEKCSEKLKNEKETLEDSFRFHSAEQEHMTLDLIDKMRELQAAGENSGNQKSKKKPPHKEQPQRSFDLKIVERLQDLSTQLVKQTKELEEALAERTRQICQLRWELLHRDVSTVKLETELHSAHIQGASPQKTSKCQAKRAKYAHFRSWSSEEASNRSRQIKECSAHSPELIKAGELPDAYYKLPKTKIQAIELSNTVHELNRELIRLSSAAESLLGGNAGIDDENTSQSTGKESAVDPKTSDSQSTEQVVSSDVSSVKDAITSCEASPSTYQGNEGRTSKISVRRNSASSISTVSVIGPEDNENFSPCCEKNRVNVKTTSPSKPSKKPVRNLSWTDSESSTEEESFTRVPLYSRTDRPTRTTTGQEAILKYPHLSNAHEYATESEDSPGAQDEIKAPQHARKRKLNYKQLKNTRRQNKNGLAYATSSKDNTYLGSDDKSSHSKITLGSTEAKSSSITTKTANPSAHIYQSDIRLRLQIPMVYQKSEASTDPLVQKGFPRVFKSHSDRRSDSRTTHSERTSIKKSESLACAKDRKRGYNKVCLESMSRGITAFQQQREESSRRNHKNTTKQTAKSQASSGTTIQTDTSTISEKNSHGNVNTDNNGKTADKTTEVDILDRRTLTVDSPVRRTETSDSNKTDQQQEHLPEHDSSTSERKENGATSKACTTKDKRSLTSDVNEPHLSDQTQTGSFPSICHTLPENHSPTYVIKLPKRKSKISDKSKNTSKTQQEQQKFTVHERKPSDEQSVTVVIQKRRPSKGAEFHKTSCMEPPQCDNSYNIPTDVMFPGKLEKESSNINRPNSFLNVAPITRGPLTDDLKRSNLERVSDLEVQTDSTGKLCASTYNDEPSTGTIAATCKTTSENPPTKGDDRLSTHADTNGVQSNFCSQGDTKATPVVAETATDRNCIRSPSDTQLEWRKICAKKTSREGAPNVRTLIEKYNQKVLENQTYRSPCTSTYNSPVAARKISAPVDSSKTNVKSIPFSFSSTPSSPRVITAFSNHNPLSFKPITMDFLYSTNNSPHTSPSSRARSDALLKAKEKFISSTSITAFTPANVQPIDSANNVLPNPPQHTKGADKQNVTQRSITDSEITKTRVTSKDADENRASLGSDKSSDSMNLVLYRTGETCQESRLSKRYDKQKSAESQTTAESSQLKATKSLSTSSVFKTLTTRDIFPASLFRLRRSRRKKDMGTISQLCRQSLMLGDETLKSAAEEIAPAKSPRSCPSSPETKTKNKFKSSWLQRNIFRQK